MHETTIVLQTLSFSINFIRQRIGEVKRYEVDRPNRYSLALPVVAVGFYLEGFKHENSSLIFADFFYFPTTELQSQSNNEMLD